MDELEKIGLWGMDTPAEKPTLENRLAQITGEAASPAEPEGDEPEPHKPAGKPDASQEAARLKRELKEYRDQSRKEIDDLRAEWELERESYRQPPPPPPPTPSLDPDEHKRFGGFFPKLGDEIGSIPGVRKTVQDVQTELNSLKQSMQQQQQIQAINASIWQAKQGLSFPDKELEARVDRAILTSMFNKQLRNDPRSIRHAYEQELEYYQKMLDNYHQTKLTESDQKRKEAADRTPEKGGGPSVQIKTPVSLTMDAKKLRNEAKKAGISPRELMERQQDRASGEIRKRLEELRKG